MTDAEFTTQWEERERIARRSLNAWGIPDDEIPIGMTLEDMEFVVGDLESGESIERALAPYVGG